MIQITTKNNNFTIIYDYKLQPKIIILQSFMITTINDTNNISTIIYDYNNK